MSVASALAAVRGFIIDLDGTTYLGDRVIPGAREFIELLGARGYRWVFVTNNSATSSESYVAKLRRMNLPVADDQVLTSGKATAMYLRRQGYQHLYVVGTPSLEEEMTRAGFVLDAESADCVVLGFDKTLTYAKLETATRLIRRQIPFVATHPDVVCPTETGYVPDCGAMIALLAAATGISPTVVGKPEPLLVEMALTQLGLEAREVAIVGDRLYTDMEMARRTGTLGVLVLSGETTRAMADAATPPPDLAVEGLGAIGPLLTPSGT